MNPEKKTEIESLINNNKVMLFMKGNKYQPQCGFSKQVIDILNHLTTDYETCDVLADPEIRQGIKEYSNWPTIPQLYINKEFIGGTDIVTDLFKSGELLKLLGIELPKDDPTIHLTKAGLEELKKASTNASDDEVIRFSISADFTYGMHFDKPVENDFMLNIEEGLTMVMDPITATRADGLTIDYIEDNMEAGFCFDNPNEIPAVKELSVHELANWHKENEDFILIDVRPKDEAVKASIPFARLLEEIPIEELNTLDKNKAIVFHCHHGGRSLTAAESFKAKGFLNLYNLKGGIHSWAIEIDDSVPKY